MKVAVQRLERKIEIVRPVNKSYGAACRAWRKTWRRHLNKDLIDEVSESFNQKHYRKTGELFGFKLWDTLQKETGLSESTVEPVLQEGRATGRAPRRTRALRSR